VSPVVEVVFLRPTFVPQAQANGLGVTVKAEEPRALQRPAPGVVRRPTPNRR
jgi:hypothetical protein